MFKAGYLYKNTKYLFSEENTYATGFYAALILIILHYLEMVDFNFLTSAGYVIGSVFLIPFIRWVIFEIRRLWGTPIGQLFLIFFNATTLLLSTIQSREIVSSAIRLPAQDFDIAVYAVTLIYYPPLFFCSFSIFLVFLTILSATTSMCFSGIKILVGITSGDDTVVAGRAVGAVFLAALLSGAYSYLNKDIAELLLKHIALNVAYYGDYQIADKYPGIPKGTRIRLHENGVISIATKGESGVSIEVMQIE